MVYGIYPRCYEVEPSNPEGITYTPASEGSMGLNFVNTVDCLPPITGREKLGRALMLNSLE